MKSFLIKILYFIIPLILLLGSYEYFLRKSNTPNIYSYKNELLKSKYNAVILGNSHALRGILAENLNYSTISLANVSQSIAIDYEWLKQSLENHKLKFVILNFSIPTLTGNLFKSKENWRLKNYNIYTDLQLDYSFEHNFEFLTGKQTENLNLLFKNTKALNGYLSRGSSPIDAKLTQIELKKHAHKAAERHSTMTDINENINYIDKIISLSKQYGFDLIVVTPPVSSHYRKLISNNLLTEFNKVSSERCNKHSNVVCLNLYKSPKFEDSMFKDSDHLNLEGAAKFTKEINMFLNQHYSN